MDACIAIEMRKAGQAFRRFQMYHFQLVLLEVRGLELVKVGGYKSSVQT
jgi:hypothetical protein